MGSHQPRHHCVFIRHPSSNSTCILVQTIHTRAKFRFCITDAILLIRWNKHASTCQNTRNHTMVNTTLCSKKTCDHIFDDKLKQNYPFTKIFGTLITKSVGHRQVYSVSHLTYFVHLLYLGKLSRPKYHEFSLKFLIFFDATILGY